MLPLIKTNFNKLYLINLLKNCLFFKNIFIDLKFLIETLVAFGFQNSK